MFPLKQRKLIRGAKAHVLAGLGIGADYVASVGTPLYAPFDGVISIPYGASLLWRFNQGGKWIRLTRSNGDILEFAHNSNWALIGGAVEYGMIIAFTGNTGKITTGPHCHIQIFVKGKRVDPEQYNWGTESSLDVVRKSINGHFQDVFGKMPTVEENSYYLARINDKDISTEDILVGKMKYWKSMGKTMGK